LFSTYDYRTFVGRGGGGKGKRKIRRKNGGPFTLLKYVATAYFLIPLAKLPPLTNGPKKDEGYYVFSSTLVTDGLGSVPLFASPYLFDARFY
jgi:hypothetical protein